MIFERIAAVFNITSGSDIEDRRAATHCRRRGPMTGAEIATVAGAGAGLLGGIGATVRWAAAQFREQGRKLARLEGEYAALYREHSLVLVRIERFRLAFQMVAAELSRKSPGNIALVHASALLDESFHLEPEPDRAAEAA
jgi:hypothetical protein